MNRPQGQQAGRGRARQLFRWLGICFAILIGCAAATAVVSAQEASGCDPADPATAATCGATPRQAPAQTETSPDDIPVGEEIPEPKPEPQPEPPPPPPPPPAPGAQSAPVPCADGTLPPCPPPAQVQAPGAGTKKRLDCRKRPGKRLPKRCPRLRRPAGDRQAEGRRGAKRRAAIRERRRAARERQRLAKVRKQCNDGSVNLLGATAQQCRKAVDRGGILVGRLASRPLGDPLPPGKRLDAAFARLLKRIAGRSWPVVLATLRAQGKTGAAPADANTLRKLTKSLRGAEPEERVAALADYHRAVGLDGLVQGIDAVKGQLMDRVLRTPTISIYGAGRTDVATGGVDVRVLVTMLYLAERRGGISVTSLVRGHGVLTKSGNVSLHSYGRAMDIAAVGGTPIIGNQQPGGITESALRDIMMLPPELRPQELISLFEIGGPSFAMADHADHIHVGF